MASLAFLGNLTAAAARVTARRAARGPLRPSWSWGMEVVFSAMKARGAALAPRSWAEQRAGWAAMIPPEGPIFRQVTRRTTTLAGRPAEWFVPRDASPGVVLYLHGGSFIYGSLASHAEVMARVAVASGAAVVGLDYRLAPEHPFPAGLEDCVAAYRALQTEPMSPQASSAPPGMETTAPVVIAGDSAGGNLALATCLALRDAGERPAGAVLLSPWVDLGARGGSLVEHAAFDWGDPADFVAWARAYLGAAPAAATSVPERDGAPPDARLQALLADPRVSPLHADLGGLPPLLVVVGTAEMLLDQVRAFAAKAEAAGTSVERFEHPDMVHNGISFAGLFAACRAVEAPVGAFVRARLAAAR